MTFCVVKGSDKARCAATCEALHTEGFFFLPEATLPKYENECQNMILEYDFGKLHKSY